MTRFSFKQLLVVAFACVLAFGAFAVSAKAAEKNKQKQEKQQKARYHSSIQVPNDEREESGEAREEQGKQETEEQGKQESDEDEAADTARYQSLAKITKEQAIKSAKARLAGKVLNASLDNEDGNLVYSVEIRTKSGVADVKVDAGNGKVLFIDRN